MPRVYVSLGSNCEREKNIAAGLTALENAFGALQQSRIYESAAVGGGDAFYYNLVVGFESVQSVQSLVAIFKNIELNQGRSHNKTSTQVTLDLDLLLYGDAIIDDENLHLPRADIERYAFVLEPLAEIAADLIHPVSGKSYRLLWQQFDKRFIKQRMI